MLYDYWRQIASAAPRELALCELTSGRRWTFAQLASAVEDGATASEPVAFPEGNSADFVLAVLCAWRLGQVACPLDAGQTRPPIRKRLPTGIVHLKMTSATTGHRRLVAFTAAQLVADAEHIVQGMGLKRDWPNLGVISLAHSYGFSNLVLPLLLHGVPLILAGAPLPETLRRAASYPAGITLAAVPALWRTWHEARCIPGNIRLAISAGAPLPLSLERDVFEHAGLKLHNFYGSSECGGIAYDSSARPRSDSSCAGTPLPGIRLSVTEDDCLEIRSDAVAETYWPTLSPDLGAGLFRTRDLGELSGGQVFLRGRADDRINLAGRKVLPETIEKVLSAHPEVRACLAFGVPSADAQRGEKVVACVSSTAKLSGESLRQFALEKLPAWQVPREWWFVDGIETNARGKLSRSEWRKRYLARCCGETITLL